MHLADTGHEGSEGADNGDEPGEKNSFTAMTRKKMVGFVYVFLIERNFGVGDDFLTKKMTDPIINRITEYCSYR